MRSYFGVLIGLNLVVGNVLRLDAAEYTEIGDFCGRPQVSADGTVVAGTSAGLDGKCFSQGYQTILWTLEDGVRNLGTLSGESTSHVGIPGELVSFDGTTVAGDGGDESFRWTESSGMERLGTMQVEPGASINGSDARAMSNDGRVVFVNAGVTTASGDLEIRPYRWAVGGIVEPLEVPFDLDSAYVYSVSQDGHRMVGAAYSRASEFGPVEHAEAFIWEHTQGYSPLDDVPSEWPLTAAIKISPDGSTVIGNSAPLGPWAPLFRWSGESGFQPLFGPNGKAMQGAPGWVSMRDDGSVVVGTARDGVGFYNFVWTEHQGARMLPDILANEHGLTELPWNEPIGVTDITPDTMTIVGSRGSQGETPYVYWMIQLDKPLVSPLGDFDEDHSLSANDVDLLSAQIRANEYREDFDLDTDQAVDANDRRLWVHDLVGTYFGDANLDGEFNSSDLVAVFEAGQYEDGVVSNSSWATGDWNGDVEFSTSDLVLAFQDGGYEQGPRGAVTSVPEPATIWPLTFGLLLVARRSSAKWKMKGAA